MKRTQLILTVLVLTAAGVAFLITQERSYSIDPPGQTDRMWTKGWPHQYRRVGGIAGFDECDWTAYLANLWHFFRPALLASIGIALVPPLVRYVVVTSRTRRRLRRGLCPRCGYDLRGVPAGVCPECGAATG